MSGSTGSRTSHRTRSRSVRELPVRHHRASSEPAVELKLVRDRQLAGLETLVQLFGAREPATGTAGPPTVPFGYVAYPIRQQT